MDYEVVIGLEVHVQLNTKSKIFCGCSTEFGASPNTHVCPVCLGQPGVLPVFNSEVLRKSVQAGLSLQCEIAEYSKFDRKNYFYPDLPKGYQISQFDLPIAKKGVIEITRSDGSIKQVGVTRAHMEEDAGKLVHEEGERVSRVDLNRAGVPLLEIVSEPDMRSSEEAYLYLKELRSIMKTIGVSDVNMEEGSLRCDANVSIRPWGQAAFGTKVEIKNMNSFNGVRKAIDYEVGRQIEVVESGGKILQETRLYDAKKNQTFSMRSKEEANDYRYFPEPDLPPITPDRAWVKQLEAELPELPRARRERLMKEYGLSSDDAITLCDDMAVADYFEAAVKAGKAGAKKTSNWVQSELLRELNDRSIPMEEFAAKRVSPKALAELLELVESDAISGKIAKDVFAEMAESGKSAAAIVSEKGLKQVSNTSELEGWVDQVMAANPSEVEKFKGGNQKLMGFFVGEIMKLSKGQANPKAVNEILRNKLS